MLSDVEFVDLTHLDIDVAEKTYLGVWNEFHRWNFENARSILDSIQNTSSYSRTDVDWDDSFSQVIIEEIFMNTTFDDPLVDVVNVKYPRLGKNESLSCKISKAASIKPFPVYESCTPSTQNILPFRETLDETVDLRFFPFADDATFNCNEYSNHFENHAWQDEFVDPDAELINLETFGKLHRDRDISIYDIDSLFFLPKSRSRNGLIWSSLQRDIIYTQFDKEQYLELVGQKTDEFDRLSMHLRGFCSNLNCIHSQCRTHIETTLIEEGHIDVVEPRLRSDELSHNQKACGENCYLLEDPSGPLTKSEAVLDEHSLNVLRTILAVSPDVIPCQLAHACRRQCHQIFKERQNLLEDDHIASWMPLQSSRTIIPSSYFDDDIDGENLKPQSPCCHVGLCAGNQNCNCYMNKVRCQRFCHCDERCETRWKGCKCSEVLDGNGKRKPRADAPCQSYNDCPCYQSGRECDPELCKSCHASGARRKKINKKRTKTKATCRNVQLQQGAYKTVEILPAAFGFGAFLRENAKADDLIGEYIGEIILKEECLSDNDVSDNQQDGERVLLTSYIRQFLTDHRKRNYAFNLDGKVTLDALIISNELRFPNHDTQKNNCIAKRKYVNGQHRIGLYADKPITKGKELLLDYGSTFFF